MKLEIFLSVQGKCPKLKLRCELEQGTKFRTIRLLKDVDKF